MDKRPLVEQLIARLKATAQAARRASQDAAQEAREGATPAERREDARVAIENGGLARGQARRAELAKAALDALDGFDPKPCPPKGPVVLGAVVEVEDEDEGGRTFFLAPSGAGEELTGPDGDGFLSVVTPASPVGRAVLGKKLGESVEVLVAGELRELTITFIG